MLIHTFVHLPFVGRKTEQKYWASGIHTWEELLRLLKDKSHARSRVNRTVKALKDSLDNKHNPYYFHRLLPPSERWRLYPDFLHKCAFLDIETTGSSAWENEITVIGLYNGKEFKQFLNGFNLDQFENEIYQYKLLVTFNGSSFDLPFLKYYFRHFEFDAAHIDLRFVMSKLGYGGGLKRIEKQLGLDRPSEVEGFSEWEAVWLWERYQNGDRTALELLLEYNRQDVINLKKLLEFACEHYIDNYVSHYIEYKLPWQT